MKIVVLGAGGVGGYLGIRMIEAGLPVRFLLRPERASRVRRHGLRLESPLGDWSGVPEVITRDEAEPADFVILSCKAYDLGDALDSVAGAVGPGTAIVPFLNGLAHLPVIAGRYPQAEVWGGVAHIGATLGADGTVIHLNRLNRFLIGPLGDTRKARQAEKIVGALGCGPVRADLRDAILQDMWDKVVFLATLAGITCLMRANIGTILSVPDGEALILQLLDECKAVAAAEGHVPDTGALDTYRGQLTDRASTSTASMLRDLEAGKPTEANHILGDLAHRAAAHRLSAPLLRTCLAHLRSYEVRVLGR